MPDQYIRSNYAVNAQDSVMDGGAVGLMLGASSVAGLHYGGNALRKYGNGLRKTRNSARNQMLGTKAQVDNMQRYVGKGNIPDDMRSSYQRQKKTSAEAQANLDNFKKYSNPVLKMQRDALGNGSMNKKLNARFGIGGGIIAGASAILGAGLDGMNDAE